MENRPMYDVRPEQYAIAIRELIRHENDVTNHRIMWLLVVQGLLVNAYVGVRKDPEATPGLAWAGILVTFSAFVMLFKSYQARGYLHFLGAEAKRGNIARGIPATRWVAETENQTLAEKHLDLSLA